MVDFVSKNRDAVNEEQVSILRGSQYDLVGSLFKEKVEKKAAPPKPGRSAKNLKKTVGRQFSESLKGRVRRFFFVRLRIFVFFCLVEFKISSVFT